MSSLSIVGANADLMQPIRDRIKLAFVELIPEEKWTELVQAEIDSFFAETKHYGYHNQQTTLPSKFSVIVLGELEKVVKAKAAEMLNTPEFQATWDAKGAPAVNGFIERVIIENSGEILKNMLANTMRHETMSLFNQLSRQQ